MRYNRKKAYEHAENQLKQYYMKRCVKRQVKGNWLKRIIKTILRLDKKEPECWYCKRLKRYRGMRALREASWLASQGLI
jgi:hypothetical protein